MPIGLRVAIYLFWFFFIGGNIFGGIFTWPGRIIMVVVLLVVFVDIFRDEIFGTRVDRKNGEARDKRRDDDARKHPTGDHH